MTKAEKILIAQNSITEKNQYLPSGVSTWLILTAVTESPASSTAEQGLIESDIFPSVFTDKSQLPHIMTCKKENHLGIFTSAFL